MPTDREYAVKKMEELVHHREVSYILDILDDEQIKSLADDWNHTEDDNSPEEES